MARFGGGGDTSLPTEAELRERKTVSIAERNQKAAQEDAQGGEEVAKPGQIGNKGKEGNTYWGGDSTMFEGKDD